MVVLRESEEVRTLRNGRLSLVDSGGLNSPASSGSNRAVGTSGVVPDRIPQPLSNSSDSEPNMIASELNNGNMNQPKLAGIILALVLGSYFFFK